MRSLRLAVVLVHQEYYVHVRGVTVVDLLQRAEFRDFRVIVATPHALADHVADIMARRHALAQVADHSARFVQMIMSLCRN